MRIIIGQNIKSGDRVDLFVLSELKQQKIPNVPSRSFLKEIFNNVVTVNGERVKPSYKLKNNDILEIDEDRIGEEMSNINANFDIKGQNGDLHILGESEEYLVVEKPKGLVVHPGVGNRGDTLANFVRGYLERKGEFNNQLNRAGLVHRLDKGVSGIMVFAKTPESQKSLQKQFEDHSVKKVYLAQIEGECVLPIIKTTVKEQLDMLEKNDFEIDGSWYMAQGYIGRSKRNRIKMEFKEQKSPNSKRAISYLKRISNDEVLIVIVTGRMHQIRATLESFGVNIKGDSLYQSKSGGPISDEINLQSILLSFSDLKDKRITFRIY